MATQPRSGAMLVLLHGLSINNPALMGESYYVRARSMLRGRPGNAAPVYLQA
jgi:hypothetical protein